jgi:hypothetical protein
MTEWIPAENWNASALSAMLMSRIEKRRMIAWTRTGDGDDYNYPVALKSFKLQRKAEWIMEAQAFEMFTALEFHPFRNPRVQTALKFAITQ